MKLGEYRKKRRETITNEPFGEEPTADGETLRGAFVVQIHDATRRHYDVRLEVGGVLVSFAVPHGPSLDPDAKHLAVKTEDHPIEYLEFEDVIPDDQYGAGPMIVWDRGEVEYLEGPAEEEIANGKLHIRFRGHKLQGRYAFVKLAKSEKGNEWLFFKKADEHASRERKLTEELPRSVLSGLTVEELERAGAIGKAHVASAKSIGGTKGGEDFSLLPIAVGQSTTGCVYDAQLDGIRALASKDGDAVSIALEDGTHVEMFYPEIVRALRALPFGRIVLDGTIVAFDDSGHPSPRRLAQRALRIGKGDVHRATTEMPVVMLADDLLALGEIDTRPAPLGKRRGLLSSILPTVGFLRTMAPLEGPITPILAFCASHDIPGLVAKKKNAAYEGRWTFVGSGVAPRSRAVVDHRADEEGAALKRVPVTNPKKVFWPEEGYTKGDLIAYYGSIADTILPYLRDRPVILVRYPDGIAGKNFYQWNVPPGMPAWVRTLEIDDEDGKRKRGFLLDDPSTLMYVANLGCIPLHILAARTPELGAADFFTIDFDVKQSTLANAIILAKTLEKLLVKIGLPGYPKTSGQSGLHVLVPLGRGQNFTTARALADLLGRLLVERHPEIATMERTIQKRGPKVYVDTGQTGASRAIVAPYSVRAVAGAKVSTPLRWSEVNEKLDLGAFTIRTVPARIAKVGDLLAGMLAATPDVPAAVAKISSLLGSR